MREPCWLPTPTCHGPSPKCFLRSFVFSTILGNFYNLVKEEVRIGKRSPADKPEEGGKGASGSKTEPWKASSQLRVGLAPSCALSLDSLGLGSGKHSINSTLRNTVWSEERCPGVHQSRCGLPTWPPGDSWAHKLLCTVSCKPPSLLSQGVPVHAPVQ